jgi:YVTN family beta-propeller protein
MLTTLRRIASQAADFSIAVALVTGCMMQGSSPAASAETQSAVTSDSAKVVATITVGSEPFDLAVTPDGNDVYVVNYASSSVSVINASLNTVVGTVALGSQDGPTRVTITPDGTSALVLAGTNIYVISTSTNTLVNTIALGSDFGMGLAVTPDGTQLYVSRFHGGLSIFDLSTYQVEKTLTLGNATWNVAISPDGKSAYVLTSAGSSGLYVAKIKVASQTIVNKQFGSLGRKGTSTAIVITADSSTLYLPGGEKDVSVMDAATGKLGKEVVIFPELGSHDKYQLAGAGLSVNGKTLYVAETGAHAVTTVSTVRGKQFGTPIQVGKGPTGIAVSPSGSYMYVANYTGGTVSVVQLNTP